MTGPGDLANKFLDLVEEELSTLKEAGASVDVAVATVLSALCMASGSVIGKSIEDVPNNLKMDAITSAIPIVVKQVIAGASHETGCDMKVEHVHRVVQ